jgi:hypothetical protein
MESAVRACGIEKECVYYEHNCKPQSSKGSVLTSCTFGFEGAGFNAIFTLACRTSTDY